MATDWLGLLAKLQAVEAKVEAGEGQHRQVLDACTPQTKASVLNLVHYLALRQVELRPLQLELAEVGLSSLSHSESYVRQNLAMVRRRVEEAASSAGPAVASTVTAGSWKEAESLLHARTQAIFGPKPCHRHVFIMVTAPDPAVATDEWFDQLITAGMNVLRINAAHGDQAAWATLIERAKSAALRHDHPLKVLVDLPGPKIRTVSLQPDLTVLKLKPQRDQCGRVISPCQVHLVAAGSPQQPAPAQRLSLPGALVGCLSVGDRLEFHDLRGRKRVLCVTAASGASGGAVATLCRSAYLGAKTELVVRSPGGNEKGRATPSELPQVPVEVRLAVGSSFALVASAAKAASTDLPSFGCTLPAVFTAVTTGQTVWLDDGKVQATATSCQEGLIVLRIERGKLGLAKLRGDMGINLPDSDLGISALTSDDLAVLRFAVPLVDIIGLSFVRSRRDVADIEQALGDAAVGLMLKIETRAGFSALGDILLHQDGRPLAVMIARGDLAVECGFERLVEVQEEILWLCEAAHVPVIWATQVLETLAKTGFASRAEITDAGIGVGAECVMLNKGPFIAEATATLDQILQHMETHRYKKRSLARALKVTRPIGVNRDILFGDRK